jgi:hypothetical protein
MTLPARGMNRGRLVDVRTPDRMASLEQPDASLYAHGHDSQTNGLKISQ